MDIEIALCVASLQAFGTSFVGKYGANVPTTVFTRKLVNLPNLATLPPAAPAPWDVEVPFDLVLFVFFNSMDLLHEVVVWSSTIPNVYPLDAVNAPTTMNGGFSAVDLGCTTANGLMQLRSRHVAGSATNTLTLSWLVTGAPALAPAAVLVGLSDPDVPIPGLCGGGKLHTDVTLLALNGQTDASGTLLASGLGFGYDPRFPAFTLTAQAVAVDFTQGQLPVAASNGVASPLPPLPSAVQAHRLFASGSPTASAGTLLANSCLVTRFR